MGISTIGSKPVGCKGQFAGRIMNLIHYGACSRIIRQHIIDEADTKGTKTVLDIGCGGVYEV